ncbi:MAG: hypothetical protein HOK97_10975 [Deltaproteobacteria bacterium]|nr:hypothetical protein [Deltaproteobacteria bacterium]MBT6490276.1 hypothetical protein [Deltaproteobacteria bacterium]
MNQLQSNKMLIRSRDNMMMPQRNAAIFVFLSLLIAPQESLSHPLKLTASLVEYDPETKSSRMECKVFRDDFERSLNKSMLKGIDPSTIKKEDKKSGRVLF